MTVAERFWAKVRKSDGCWEWTGALNKTGYGWFNADWDGRGPELAHRVSFRLAHGTDGYFVCHHCDNRRCVRPEHLYDGTPASNIQDMVARGRHGQKSKTHCPQGHPYTGENVIVAVTRKGIQRTCKACGDGYKRRYRELHRERSNAERRARREAARAAR